MRHFWLVLMVWFVINIAPADCVSWAGGEIKIIPISPIHAHREFRSIYLVDPGELIKGRIERIDGHGVAIDGRYRPFSAAVSFLSASGRLIDDSKFKRGTVAGIHMDAKGEITAIWNLDPEYVKLP